LKRGIKICLRRSEQCLSVPRARSPDSTRLALASAGQTFRVLDVGTGLDVFRLVGFRYAVSMCAWSPDGSRLAYTSEHSTTPQHTVRVWEARAQGLEVVTLLGHTEEVRSCAWSPDGAQLASGQGLTLVHFSAQRKRFMWDRGCTQGLVRGCLGVYSGVLGGVQDVF